MDGCRTVTFEICKVTPGSPELLFGRNLLDSQVNSRQGCCVWAAEQNRQLGVQTLIGVVMSGRLSQLRPAIRGLVAQSSSSEWLASSREGDASHAPGNRPRQLAGDWRECRVLTVPSWLQGAFWWWKIPHSYNMSNDHAVMPGMPVLLDPLDLRFQFHTKLKNMHRNHKPAALLHPTTRWR